jgi:hypothetical protein
MGGGESREKPLDDDSIVEVALKEDVGLRVFAGFRAKESRLVFLHSDQMSTSPTLYTVLPSGKMEGPTDGKALKPTPEKGLITYPYVQHLVNPEKLPNLKELIDKTHCVWLDDKAKVEEEKYPLVQVWTVNVNKEFRDVFKVMQEENPDPVIFQQQAVDNLMKTMRELFGADADKVKVQYCSKDTHNVQRTFLGTPGMFAKFFELKGVKESFRITSFDGKTMKVKTLDGNQREGQQTFVFGDEPTEEHVLYKRKGFTDFWCLKTRKQFEQDCKFEGEFTNS